MSTLRMRSSIQTSRMQFLLLPLLAVAVLVFSGCGGGGSKTVVKNRTTTIGQELSDLKRAYDSGALSEREYQNQREKILDGEE